MAEMIVTTPEVKRHVEDYDFFLGTGVMLPITIDSDRGDSIQFDDLKGEIRVKIASKPNLIDKKKFSQAEDITIFTSHLVSIHKRDREVVELSPEQQFQWEQDFAELSKTVQ